MRSLALAEAAVAAGHEVVVAGHFEGSFLQRQLGAAPVEVVQLGMPLADQDPEPLIDLVGRLRPDVLHVDSYAAAVGQLFELLAPVGSEPVAGHLVLSNMEDGSFGRRPADVVVDPTFGAELSARPDDGSTWLLRGSRYTPLRQRVMDARRRHDEVRPEGVTSAGAPAAGAAHRVLVVMGGTDPVGLAPAAVGLLARTGLALEVTAIAVGENAERVRAAALDSRLSLNVLAPVDDLPALMTGQDLVVSAAGTSVWEVCCIGVPMAVIWAVDNQREGYDRVVVAGAAVGLGGPGLSRPEPDRPEPDRPEPDRPEPDRPEPGGEPGGPGPGADDRAVGLLATVLTDSRVRAEMMLAGRRVVDGLGAWRVVRTWAQAGGRLPATDPGALVARRAGLEDARLLWLWRNDPVTRASSRSSAEVAWEDHLRWLSASLTRTDRLLLVVEDPGGPGGLGGIGGIVGTVRWDLVAAGEWEVSITVAPQRRGQSLARPLLRAGEVALSTLSTLSRLGPPGAADVSQVNQVHQVHQVSQVMAYLAVVHVDNRASVRLFETSAYVPDLPPDARGFMRFRKPARVALSAMSEPWESA